MKKYYVFIALLMAVTVAATVAQTALGKDVKSDSKLTQDISNFNNKIQNYANSHDALPTEQEAGGAPKGVTFTKLTNSTYKLCGTFATANKRTGPDNTTVLDSYYIDANYHDKGYVCFNASVNIQVKPTFTPRPIEIPTSTSRQTPTPTSSATPSPTASPK